MTMIRHYTFGPDHTHPDTGESLGRQYVTVLMEGERGYDACRARMFRYFGPEWAAEYSILPRHVQPKDVAEWPREQYDRAKLGPEVCEWMDANDPDMAPAKS